jgi:IclR helix-turn-helix domain
MVQLATSAPNTVECEPGITARALDHCAEVDRLPGPASPEAAGRRVLDGAFAILEALSRADDGLGLTALARASGLAKASAYRLAEQLVSLGAVQRVDCRYYIGARIDRMGQGWQPNPGLRKAAQVPVRALAVCQWTAETARGRT